MIQTAWLRSTRGAARRFGVSLLWLAIGAACAEQVRPEPAQREAPDPPTALEPAPAPTEEDDPEPAPTGDAPERRLLGGAGVNVLSMPVAPEPGRRPARAWRVTGTVVDRAGAPLRDARVRLVEIAHGSADDLELLDGVVTGRSGAFRLSAYRPSFPMARFVVVEASGAARTVALEMWGHQALGRVRLARGRDVPVVVSCERVLDDQGGSVPLVRGLWHVGGERDFWTRRWLLPVGIEAPSLQLPGDDSTLLVHRLLPVTAGTFSALLRLPVGTSTLVIEGPCGYTTREVQVPEGDGPMAPVRLTLPRSDVATLELRLTWAPPEAPGVLRGWYSIGLWDDAQFSESPTLSRSEAVFVRGIPPGTYHLGDHRRPECQRVIELRPGARERIELDVESCLVRYEPPITCGNF